jgi:capsular polysaccharide biosynthesis protein
MSEQPLDLKRSWTIVRRHKILVAVFALLGLLAAAGYMVLRPPMPASNALVVLPATTHNTATQVVIATSDPVLGGALRRVNEGISVQTLRERVQVTSLTPGVLSISAQGTTDEQAEDIANAIAKSYVATINSPTAPAGRVRAYVLQLASTATKRSLAVRLIVAGVLGALLGALVGATVAIAVSRRDLRLRERAEIANAIGLSVLASVPVAHPSDAAGWTKLFEEYRPGPVQAWGLRKALQDLGLSDNRGDNGASLAVLSLSSDPGALALGPQLAVYAASLGIPTVLVIGPQQDANATATLRAACAVPQRGASGPSKQLRLSVMDHHSADRLPRASLAVVVAVVNAQNPRVAATVRTALTVLGVSAGAATAEQLARVAASAADDGRQIAGILVADPDSADHTTGRLPQLAPPARRRLPTRAADAVTETRR